MHLYETHIPVAETPVAETRISEVFYREIVGLRFAYRDPTRDIVFMWVDTKEKAMLGLWGPNTAYGRQNGVAQNCHVAFAVSLDELLPASPDAGQKPPAEAPPAAPRQAQEAIAGALFRAVRFGTDDPALKGRRLVPVGKQ